MRVVSSEISICEKVGNHPFLAFLFLFLTICRSVGGSSRQSLGIYRGIGAGCAALSAFTVASAQVAPLSKHLLKSLGKSVLKRGIAYVEPT